MQETPEQRRARFGNYAGGNYILCYVSDEGRTISPQGNGKSYKYATELLKEYRERVPKQNWQLYKLKRVRCLDDL